MLEWNIQEVKKMLSIFLAVLGGMTCIFLYSLRNMQLATLRYDSQQLQAEKRKLVVSIKKKRLRLSQYTAVQNMLIPKTYKQYSFDFYVPVVLLRIDKPYVDSE